jgi:beta-galactosidase
MLRLSVVDPTGAVLSYDERALTIFPRLPAPAPLKARWGLFDPAGQTTAEWAKVGLRARPIKAGESVAGLDVLVLGRGSLTRESRLPFTPEDVKRGLRVLVLEQELAGLEALGFRAEDVVPRYVFARVHEHPALAGLTDDDLANWRGEGTLLPRTSAGMRIWPWAHGPHVGNTGSVASVVIETPQKGAFTPILECEFDLAYTPLLSWRHGKGEVIFSQLDFAGRLGAEPAADRLARNLLQYMDRLSAIVQGRQALVLGKAAEGGDLIGELGLKWRAVEGGALSKLSPANDVVVVGPGAAEVTSKFGPELASFVASGGTVVFLPQDPAGLAAAGLPWAVPTQATSAARVAPAAIDKDPLLRGIGPELVHWRTLLEGNTFATEGLPPGAQRLLDGWLLRVASGKGAWVFCQVDWRRLEDGSDNLRRARWNVRKLYRQLLTNLGVATDDGVAAQMLEGRSFAPMATVNVWQVLQQAVPIAPEATKDNTLPGLGVTLDAERWVQSPTADKRRDYVWRLRAADANGYVDLTHLSAAKVGQAGYAVTQVFSSVPRKATVSLSADYWLVLRVNGAAVVDQSKEPRPASAPRPGELRLSVPLQAGWNRLEIKVGSGSGGFGFWCQVSDPGDLRVAPTVIAPQEPPGEAPAVGDLKREPLSVGAQLLYAEILQKEDDPYGFTAW